MPPAVVFGAQEFLGAGGKVDDRELTRFAPRYHDIVVPCCDGCAVDLARTELMRAVRRAVPDRVLRARAVLDSLVLTQVTPAVFENAGRLDPPGLRSLDAIHLASALDLGDDLDGLVTYDDRLAEAAVSYGVVVVAPR